MADENAVRDELIALLRYANKTAISRKLGLSPQAVKNWSVGKNTSLGRLEQVRRLYGLPVASGGQTKEAAAIDWRRLEQTVYAIARQLKVEVPGDAEAMAREMDAELGRKLGGQRHAAAGRGRGSATTDGSPGSKRPAR